MSARKKPAKQARTPPASGPERVTKPVDLETFLTLRDLLLCSPNSKEKARATIKLNPQIPHVVWEEVCDVHAIRLGSVM